MMFEYFYDQKILLLNEHKLKSIVEYNYSESLIPDMTVYSNAIGTIRASTEGGSGYEAWRAFTDSNQNWGSSTTGYPQWIGFTFNDLTKVNKYEVTNGNGTLSTRYPTSWTFEGSLDNLEWTVLDSRKGESWTGEKTAREFEFINSKAFKIYRLNISSGNNTISIGINRIKMFYKPQPTLITINKMSPTENEFLSYGMESSNVKTLISFDTVRSIELETSQFGSGKVFEHSVDLSKRRTKKILLL
ncbi:discoidin domain-containing protein [Paenibacillus sp. JCM 10914]|uniref:discoidin domain-containing protein n=1 Tax=Paenibacillus sp. JCM 10914 TaxID=1236974 RepID=UPI0003CCA260|nr:discoidin domain-containing protein [Paenibacillus sp. JCM 10914]GAE05266.1 hypothetical protein JCM10914_1361 [Paenibacillus sp. JCM 10914]